MNDSINKNSAPLGPSDIDDDTLADLCKALGHPARLKIIKYLKKMDQCICGDIVQLLPLAQSTVSQHLKALKKAGLVVGEVEGPRTCYCLNKDMLEIVKTGLGML
jgi:ArsR family transcriptional regulator